MDAAEQVLGAWVHEHGPVEHVALDGVVGQLPVAPDGDEITAALSLLTGLPLAGRW